MVGTTMEETKRAVKKLEQAAIEVRDELPRNPAGKVMKADLRKPYWEGQT